MILFKIVEVICIKEYGGFNLDRLKLLGTGTQGSVYKIDEHRCIKIFKKKNYCQDELHSLLISQIDPHFTKLYSYGDDYIIRQYVNGISLDVYLSQNPLSDEICDKIIEIYKAMYFVGFKRLDFALFHVYLLDKDENSYPEVMIIDTAKAMKKSYAYPSIVINSLDNLKLKDKFLSYVETNYSEIYNRWFPAKH